MKKVDQFLLIVLLLCLFSVTEVMAQGAMHSVSGTVRDAQTGRKLPQASITTSESHEATVTNADGRFTLKTQKPVDAIYVSCLGYSSIKVSLEGKSTDNLKIKLSPGYITLSEVIVSAMNPLDIVLAAMDKVHDNYSRNNELMRCFYRETTQKGKRYIYVAEAVTDLYKSGYNRLTGVDRVSIEKGRKLVSARETDTLGAKIQGGPTLPVTLDLVKQRGILLDREELEFYHLRMEVPVTINDRPQLVISFEPAVATDHVLQRGRMYIDRQNLAFTRIEMALDMSDEAAAAACILLHKPAGVRFKPRELLTTVAYRYDNGVSRLHYLHSDVRFYCEWRKKLFASPYHVEAEMVVTDLLSENAEPISGKSSFSSRDSYYDKVQYFTDPDFWGDYNIIEPSESLENAIHKLRKR